jgi:hypothetical protein
LLDAASPIYNRGVMTMPTPPSRRWFQFSMASLLWLMLVAALATWRYVEHVARRRAETTILLIQISNEMDRHEQARRDWYDARDHRINQQHSPAAQSQDKMQGHP